MRAPTMIQQPPKQKSLAHGLAAMAGIAPNQMNARSEQFKQAKIRRF